MKIKITNHKTFGKKALAKVIHDNKLILFNVFGFGFWIIK